MKQIPDRRIDVEKAYRPSQRDSKIFLREIIEQHRRYTEGPILAGSVGDGYLYATNPIFRAIRNQTLSLGYQFTTCPPFPYFSFPLMALNDIFQAKMIPYLDNFHWFGEVEKRAPRRVTLREMRKWNIRANYHLHESAHVIAHSISRPYLRKRGDSADGFRVNMTRILMNESFANAVEALGYVFVYSEIGNYFYAMNSYSHKRGNEHLGLLQLTHQIGLQKTTLLTLLFFLYSNFLFERITKAQRQSAYDIGGLTSSEKLAADKVFPSICNLPFRLTKGFRVYTSQAYFMAQGYPRDVLKILDFDPGQFLGKNIFLIRELRKMAHAVCSETPRKFI